MGDIQYIPELAQSIRQMYEGTRKKVLLFIDNAPSHPKNFRLSDVNVVLLLVNTISLLQPLDQGIIATIKNCQKHLLKAVLT